MFVVEALANFSPSVVNPQPNEPQINDQNQSDQKQTGKRGRSKSQEHKIAQCAENQQQQGNQQQQKKDDQQEKQPAITYTTFQKGEKILVKQTYQNGWWYGHAINKPQLAGFFPSNYVSTGVKPPPPQKKQQKNKQKQEEDQAFDPQKHLEGSEWITDQLKKIQTGPVKSDYYQGIKGYKMVKIDEKNQNILKGNHVKFDGSTGIAKVPVKDQAPAAKAVRQMGYYFDYHQWNQTMNNQQPKRARPDIKKKKPKKLKLKMMD